MTRIVARYAVLAAGVVAMFVGGLVLAFRATPTLSFGWSAYAPLERRAGLPDLSQPIGLLLVILGFAASVAWIGFQIGRSPVAPSHPAKTDPGPDDPTQA
jgi:formate hydrogenlyase subunit 3/multisubunit Na+/H+ antiporter MnhD subunit